MQFNKQRLSLSVRALLVASLCAILQLAQAEPVLFVTQTPFSDGSPCIDSIFGNHLGSAASAPRGGDLYIRYDDGTLRNLTQPLGYGTVAGQEIAVRDPAVDFTGTKALFSMVIGGTGAGNTAPVFFQIYEITGIGQGQTAAITHLNQPVSYNNVSPCYMQDGSVLFTSDRPRNGDSRFYPLHDEYRGSPSNTGLWEMNHDGSNLHIIDANPSGDFSPIVDSYGRIVFMRWDHLERDQQADRDIDSLTTGGASVLHSETFPNEATFTPHALTPTDEVFPELGRLHPQNAAVPDPVWDFQHQADERQFEFNRFFPWAMNPDGTEMEVLNHLGRHELNQSVGSARTTLPSFRNPAANPDVVTRVSSFLTPREDQLVRGYFYGISCPEFNTHGAGQIVALRAPPNANAANIYPEYITYYETSLAVAEGGFVGAKSVGMFRDPLPRADGSLWAVHSTEPHQDFPLSPVPPAPSTTYTLTSRYNFRIKSLVPGTAVSTAGAAAPTTRTIAGSTLLASPINRTITYVDPTPNRGVSYLGAMWELQPVSVAVRAVPPSPTTPVPALEDTIAQTALGGPSGVAALRTWMVTNNLALVVSRDVTMRADQQQDYVLKIKWSLHQTPSSGTSIPKELAYMQFLEGDYIRGYGAANPGRRAIAHAVPGSINPPLAAAPSGAVKLGDDGSMAAFVPARRALSWQATADDGTPSVRERYWLNFQPGEIRSCKNCHGINLSDVFGSPPPSNSPQALVDLLNWYKTTTGAHVDGWDMY